MSRLSQRRWANKSPRLVRSVVAKQRMGRAFLRRVDLEPLEGRVLLSVVFNNKSKTVDIDSSTPVDLEVENTKAGQTIPLVLDYSTSDSTTPEDTENEWVEIRGSDGYQVTVMDYGTQTIQFPITQNGETISAWIDGADGDESGTITAGDREIKVDVNLKDLSAPFTGFIDDVKEAESEFESYLKYAPGWQFDPPKLDKLEIQGKIVGQVDIGPDGSVDGGQVSLEGSIEGGLTTELFWGLPFKIVGLSASLTAGFGVGLGVTAQWNNGVSEFKGEVKPEASLKLAGNVYVSALKGTVYGKGTLSVPMELNTDGEGTGHVDLTGQVGGELHYNDSSESSFSEEFGPLHVTTWTFSAQDVIDRAVQIAENAALVDPLIVSEQPPATVTAGTPFGMVVTATNADGSVNTGFNGNVTVSDPGLADLAGPTTVNAVNGVATFTGLSLTGGGTSQGHQLYVSDASDSVYSNVIQVTSTPFGKVVPLAASAAPAVSKFAFVGRVGTIPAAWEAGVPVVVPGVPFRIAVDAENSDGSLDIGYNGPVTLVLANNLSGATLGGMLTVRAVNGVATFTDLTVDKAGRGYQLTTSDSASAPGTSNTFDVADFLAITTAAPRSIVAGAPFGLVAEAQDGSGHVDKTFNGNITISESNYSGGATDLLLGPLTVQAVNGVATFAGLKLDQAGDYSVLLNGEGVIFTSQLFQVTPAPATQLAVTTQPPPTATVGAPFTSVVKAEDAFGNVNPGVNGIVTLALGSNPGGATLGGTLTAAVTNGVAMFSNLTIDGRGSGYTLEATATGLNAANSSPFNVAAVGVATRLVIDTPPPGRLTAGAGFGLVVKAEDGAGALDTSFNGPVTLGLGQNRAGGTLGGTLMAQAVNGVATFAGLTIDKAGTYTIAASGTGLASAITTSLGVAAAPASQIVVVPPVDQALTGLPFATTVRIEDAYGNVVSVSQSVTLTLAANPGSATLGGTLTTTTSGGVAIFSGLTIDKPGSGYTLQAASGSLPAGVSPAFDVENDRLAITTLPLSGQAAGTSLGLVVEAEGPSGSVDTTYSGPVTLGLIDYDATGATLGGTLTVAASAGVATFSGLTVNAVGSFALTVSAGGAIPVTTGVFNVAAARLSITTQPPVFVTATAPFSVTVSAGGDAGEVDPTFNGPVTLALASNPGGAMLGGTLTTSAVNGVATFSGVTIDKPGSGYTLEATSVGLAPSTTGAMAVQPAGVATQLVVAAAPPSGLSAGSRFGLVVEAEDNFGNLIRSFHGEVTVSDTQGALSGTVTAPAVNGVATFAGLTIDKAGLPDVLTAIAEGLVAGPVGSITVAPTAATQLVVGLPGQRLVTGAPYEVEVVAEDPYGNLDPTYVGSITLELGMNPGGASLGGTLTATADNGVASFPGVSVNVAGNGDTLVATGAGGISGTGPLFDVTADQLVFTVQPSGSVTAGAPFSASITAENAAGVIDTTFHGSVTVSAPSLGQVLNGMTTLQAVNGVASFSGLTLDEAISTGGNLTAISGNLPAAESNSINVDPASPTQLAVTAAPPANISVGAPFEVEVAVEDAKGNVETTFTGNVTLVLVNHPAGVALGGILTLPAVNGVADFTGLSLSQPGSGYSLIASVPGLVPVTTTAIHVTPAGVATRLVFTTQPPASVAAGSTFGLVVEAEDSYGTVDSNFHGSVAVSSPSGATVGGNPTAIAVNGVASFPALWQGQAGSNTVLSATGGGLNAATTVTFNVSALSATQLATEIPGGNALIGSHFGTVVFAEDPYGNVDPNFNGNVTLALANNPTGASLGGTLVMPAGEGSAFFPELSLDKGGLGYTLQARTAGLTPSTSTPFDVTADQFVVATQPAGSVAAGSPFGLTVTAQDALGNLDLAFTGLVTASLIDPGSTGATLGGTLTAKATGGVAIFSGLTLDQAGRFSLSLNSGGVGEVDTNPITVSVDPATLTTTSLTSDHPRGSVYGQKVTFTATVQAANGVPGGFIQFIVDGKDFGAPVFLSRGSATLVETTLHAAAYVVDAVFTSNDPVNHRGSRTTTSLPLQVNRAILTITANNQTKAYGAVLQPLTAIYTGFVNGDGPASLSSHVRLTTPATQSSRAGAYPIVASSARSPDYSISYHNGTLTITPPQPTSSGGLIERARAALVTTLYRDLLGRNPEPSGLSFWLKTLGRNVSPRVVALSVWRSSERRALLLHGRARHVSFDTALHNALKNETLTLELATFHPVGPSSLFRTAH